MSSTARLQFALASAVANVRPRPRAAPVMTAVLPLSVNYRILAKAGYSAHRVDTTHQVGCHGEELVFIKGAGGSTKEFSRGESGEEAYLLICCTDTIALIRKSQAASRMPGPLCNGWGKISAEEYDGAQYPRIAIIAIRMDDLMSIVISHYLL